MKNFSVIQITVPKSGSSIKSVECSLIIGVSSWVQVFCLTLNSSFALCAGIPSARVGSRDVQVQIMSKSEEGNLSPLDLKALHCASVQSKSKNIYVYISPVKARHYSDVIMSVVVSQVSNLMIVYSTFHSGADQRQDGVEHRKTLGHFRSINTNMTNHHQNLQEYQWITTKLAHPGLHNARSSLTCKRKKHA